MHDAIPGVQSSHNEHAFVNVRDVCASPQASRVVAGKCIVCTQDVFVTEAREKNPSGYYHLACKMNLAAPIQFRPLVVNVDPRNMQPLFAQPRNVPPEMVRKGVCQICKRMVYASQERDHNSKGYFHHSCFVKSQQSLLHPPITDVATTAPVVKGTCYVCKCPVYTSEMRGRDVKGYFHHACLKKSSIGVQNCIIKKSVHAGDSRVLSTKLHDHDPQGQSHAATQKPAPLVPIFSEPAPIPSSQRMVLSETVYEEIFGVDSKSNDTGF